MQSGQTVVMVRFGDSDPAGVMFYPRAIELAHAAVEDLVRQSAIGWEAWFASGDHAFPVRRAEADFFRPMRAGETVTVAARVETVGNTSVAFVVDLTSACGTAAARVRTLHVLVDKATGRPAPLTAEMRRALGA
jgi:YbgC/YbaW family acyl-CoA thioester hydrolase